MLKWKIGFPLAATLALVGSAALAQSPPPRVPPDATADAVVGKMMKHLDADKDGRISRAEAASRERLAKGFDRIDTDHDGYLSHDELVVVVSRRMAKQKAGSTF